MDYSYAKRRIVRSHHLPEYGVTFSRTHLHRLIKRGEFPQPFKLGENTNAWWGADIEYWLGERAMRRK